MAGSPTATVWLKGCPFIVGATVQFSPQPQTREIKMKQTQNDSRNDRRMKQTPLRAFTVWAEVKLILLIAMNIEGLEISGYLFSNTEGRKNSVEDVVGGGFSG
jgi:hypothetical protein